MDMEINGHEWWSFNGKTVWFDLQMPRSEDFWIGGVNIDTMKETRYHITRDTWGVHFNSSRDNTLVSSDGVPGCGPASTSSADPVARRVPLSPKVIATAPTNKHAATAIAAAGRQPKREVADDRRDAIADQRRDGTIQLLGSPAGWLSNWLNRASIAARSTGAGGTAPARLAPRSGPANARIDSTARRPAPEDFNSASTAAFSGPSSWFKA